MTTAKEKIETYGYEDVVVFADPSYDDAFIGVAEITNQAVYDFDLMVEYLMKVDNITWDQAADYVLYNASYTDDTKPIIVKVMNIND